MAPAAIGGLGGVRAAGHRGSAAAEPPGSELAWKQVAPACRGLTCMPFGPRAEVPVPRPGSCCAPWGPPEPCLEAGASPGQDGAGAHVPQLSANASAAVARSTPKRVTALRGHRGGLRLSPGVPRAPLPHAAAQRGPAGRSVLRP